MRQLYEIPRSWVWTTLEDVGEVASGGTPKTSDAENFDGEIAWVTPADLTGYTAKFISHGKRNISDKGLRTSSAKVLPEGTILFSSRAPIGYVAIAANEICTNQGFKNLIPYNELDNEYIYYYLKGSKKLAESLGSGTTFAELSAGRFAQIPIPVAPLNEQKRVVSKIEELFSDLDAGEASLKRAQKLLASYRQSVLRAGFSGELTKDWREANQYPQESASKLLERILTIRREQWQEQGKYQGPRTHETINLPELPEGWVWITVDHLLIESLMNGRSVPDAEDGFPVLRLTSLKTGKIDLSERKLGAWTEKEARPYFVSHNDFFVSRGNGSKKLVGRGGLVVNEPDPVAFPDTLIRIRINSELCQRKYLSLLWESHIMRSQIERRARTTAEIYKINQQDICSFSFPLAPFEEQQEIVSRLEDILSQIEALESWCRTELVRSTTLRQAILKAAFSGKLVLQDPNDEPAAVLLERIRAERVGQGIAQPKRGRRAMSNNTEEVA